MTAYPLFPIQIILTSRVKKRLSFPVEDKMLVLTRKIEQKIRIGNNIVITVLKVQGKDQVSLGIVAPKEMQIVREELIDEELEKKAAALNQKSLVKEGQKPNLNSLAEKLNNDL